MNLPFEFSEFSAKFVCKCEEARHFVSEKSGKIGVSLEATRLEILNFWAFHLTRFLEDRPENGSKTQGFENGFVI